jgi:hypothetical protein
MKLIKNFDTWNRLYESRLTKSTVQPLNEAEDDVFSKIMASIQSGIAYGKGSGMLDKFKDADRQSNQAIIDLAVANNTQKIENKLAALGEKAAKAKGEQREVIAAEKQKLNDQKAAIKDQVVVIKQKADNSFEALKEQLAKLEKQMTGKLAELFADQKSKAIREVKLEAAEAKLKLAELQGKATSAADAKADLVAIRSEIKAIEDKIAKGEDATADELEEVKGLQPFMPEITALTTARENRQSIQKSIDKLTTGIGESLVSEDLSGAVSAVGDDAAKLTSLTGLLDKLKVAKTAEHTAKEALYDKVKGTAEGVTTKAAITLAGGDPEKATEKDGKWLIGDLIKKWSDPAGGFIKADEYVKDVDTAIQKAKDKEAAAGGGSGAGGSGGSGGGAGGSGSGSGGGSGAVVNSYTPNVSGSHNISESIATKFKRAMDQKGPRL